MTGWSTNRLFRTHPPDLLYMRASQTPNTKTCWQGYCANIKAGSNLFSLLCDTYSELVCFPLDIQSKLIRPFGVVEKHKVCVLIGGEKYYKHWSSRELSSRDKGDESVDNYPVQSFFSGRSAFCDSNTSRFISLSVLYQPQYKLCPTRKFLDSRLANDVVVLHPKNTKWPIMWLWLPRG